MGVSNVIVVDNLPVVSPEMHPQLEHFVRNFCSQFGVIVGFWMPVELNRQMSHGGYCFVEYNTSQVFSFLSVVFI